MSLPNTGIYSFLALVSVQVINIVYVFIDPNYDRVLGQILLEITTFVVYISIFVMWSYGFFRAYGRYEKDSKTETTKNIFYTFFAPVVSVFYFLYLDKHRIAIRKHLTEETSRSDT